MDWKSLVAQLQEAGLSQNEIGVYLGRSQGWVSAVSKGAYSDLTWTDGESLRKLHARVVGERNCSKQKNEGGVMTKRKRKNGIGKSQRASAEIAVENQGV